MPLIRACDQFGSVDQLRGAKETEGRIWRDHSDFLRGVVIGAAIAREEFAEKLDISGSVVFIGLKKLVDDVEDFRRKNHSFLLARETFEQSRLGGLANNGVGKSRFPVDPGLHTE